MQYTEEQIETSNQIIYYLLQNGGELSKERCQNLFKPYEENRDIKSLVEQQGENFDCEIRCYQDVIYMMPREDNHFLGFTKSDLKGKLYSKDESLYDLSCFSILVLIVEFFDSQLSDPQSRDMMSFEEYCDKISEHLAIACKTAENAEAYKSIKATYENMVTNDSESSGWTNREKYVSKILKFLHAQDLFEYVEDDDMIVPTKKLCDLMANCFLDQERETMIRQILEEERQ